MKINLNNRTFDGKYQWLYELILDTNDLLGNPFTFVMGDNNTFQHMSIDISKWNPNSSKHKVALWLWEILKEKGYKEYKI